MILKRGSIIFATILVVLIVPNILSLEIGSLCGMTDASGTKHTTNCNTHDPSISCPAGYTKEQIARVRGNDIFSCIKSTDNDFIYTGSLCGMADVSGTTVTVNCDTHNPGISCPAGYTKEQVASVDGNDIFSCIKSTTSDQYYLGELCGFADIDGTTFTTNCNSQNPDNSCPIGYEKKRVARIQGTDLYSCIKTSGTESTQCSDGIDNDGDGGIDALVEIGRTSSHNFDMPIGVPWQNIFDLDDFSPGEAITLNNMAGQFRYNSNTVNCDSSDVYVPQLAFYDSSGNQITSTNKFIKDFQTMIIPNNAHTLRVASSTSGASFSPGYECSFDLTIQSPSLPETFDFEDFDPDGTISEFSLRYRVARFLNILGNTTHPQFTKLDGSSQSSSPKTVTMRCLSIWGGKCIIPTKQGSYVGHAYCNEDTAKKICELKGYHEASFNCRTAYSSPSDNTLVYWSESENNFLVVRADDGRFLSIENKNFKSLVCSNPIIRQPECNDGIDNDGDSKIDFCDGTNSATCDSGCISLNDDSEIPHDPQCDTPEDDSEDDPSPESPLCDINQTILIIDYDGSILPLNETSAGVRICYDYIFDVTNTDPNATVCTGDNVVLRINATSGLASIPETIDTSLTDICYDNLECRSISSGSCAADEFTTVRLSAETEATMGNASSTLPIQICCRISNPIFDGARWTDMTGIAINTANLNSLVKLELSGSDITGEILNFTIYEKQTFLGIDWLNPDEIISTNSGESITWRAGLRADGSKIGGEYYFEVTNLDNSLTISTKDNSDANYHFLDVSDTEINNPPVALINFPEDRQIYFIDSPIYFEQGSFDVDDGFSYRWELGDGTIMEGDSTNWENYNFTYTYSGEENLGQQNIRLTVTDDRGLTSTDYVSILIANSSYILAYIDFPERGNAYGKIVGYDARSTYAIDSETIHNPDGTCTKTIECVAGNCPTETRGCPTSGSLGCNYVGSCPIPVLNTPQGYDNINFCWEFDNGLSGGFCSTGISGALFDWTYGYIGRHTSRLNATLVNI